MNKEFCLPDEIPEIHLGFLSGAHFIGRTDIAKCSSLSISFDGDFWTVSAVRNGIEYVKRYKRNLSTGMLNAVIK